jgi:hypothetical protein
MNAWGDWGTSSRGKKEHEHPKCGFGSGNHDVDIAAGSGAGDAATRTDTDVSLLLQMRRTLAARLRNTDLKFWVDNALDRYPNEETI